MSDEPRAVIREVDGHLVLDDPAALAVVRGVAKHNCRAILEMHADRVIHFRGRLEHHHATSGDQVIVIINVDDPHGGPMADVLMPGHDWQPMRDAGMVPFARGLAGRDGLLQSVPDQESRSAGRRRRRHDERSRSERKARFAAGARSAQTRRRGAFEIYTY